MKKLIMFTSLLSVSSLMIAKSTVPTPLKPAIVGKVYSTCQLKQLENADKLCEQGKLLAAAKALENLSVEKKHKNKKLREIASVKLYLLRNDVRYVEQKDLENKKIASQSKQLLGKLNKAHELELQGKYSKAATLYKELSHAPKLHMAIRNSASQFLNEMRQSGQIK